MILRTYALYECNKHVVVVLLSLLVAQVIVMGLLTGSMPLPSFRLAMRSNTL